MANGTSENLGSELTKKQLAEMEMEETGLLPEWYLDEIMPPTFYPSGTSIPENVSEESNLESWAFEIGESSGWTPEPEPGLDTHEIQNIHDRDTSNFIAMIEKAYPQVSSEFLDTLLDIQDAITGKKGVTTPQGRAIVNSLKFLDDIGTPKPVKDALTLLPEMLLDALIAFNRDMLGGRPMSMDEATGFRVLTEKFGTEEAKRVMYANMVAENRTPEARLATDIGITFLWGYIGLGTAIITGPVIVAAAPKIGTALLAFWAGTRQAKRIEHPIVEELEDIHDTLSAIEKANARLAADQKRKSTSSPGPEPEYVSPPTVTPGVPPDIDPVIPDVDPVVKYLQPVREEIIREVPMRQGGGGGSSRPVLRAKCKVIALRILAGEQLNVPVECYDFIAQSVINLKEIRSRPSSSRRARIVPKENGYATNNRPSIVDRDTNPGLKSVDGTFGQS
jgi:hypothetical protein